MVVRTGSKQQVLHLEVGQPGTGAPAKVKEAAIRALQVSQRLLMSVAHINPPPFRPHVCRPPRRMSLHAVYDQ